MCIYMNPWGSYTVILQGLHTTAAFLTQLLCFIWGICGGKNEMLCILHHWPSNCSAHKEILVIKPTRCTNFSNLLLGLNSTCFGQFLCPSSGVFHCTHSNDICHTTCEQDQDGTAVLSWSCSQAVSKPVWHIPLLCVQWKTPGDGQKNCPKHIQFHSKHRFEKLVHLVGFIIRIYHAAWSPERQIHIKKILPCENVIPHTTSNTLKCLLTTSANVQFPCWSNRP